jgi:hypothetical protein
LGFAKQVVEKVTALRIKYSGRDYAAVNKELSVEIRTAGLTLKDVTTFLKKRPLKP